MLCAPERKKKWFSSDSYERNLHFDLRHGRNSEGFFFQSLRFWDPDVIMDLVDNITLVDENGGQMQYNLDDIVSKIVQILKTNILFGCMLHNTKYDARREYVADVRRARRGIKTDNRRLDDRTFPVNKQQVGYERAPPLFLREYVFKEGGDSWDRFKSTLMRNIKTYVNLLPKMMIANENINRFEREENKKSLIHAYETSDLAYRDFVKGYYDIDTERLSMRKLDERGINWYSYPKLATQMLAQIPPEYGDMMQYGHGEGEDTPLVLDVEDKLRDMKTRVKEEDEEDEEGE